jgi:hypothetical protein
MNRIGSRIFSSRLLALLLTVLAIVAQAAEPLPPNSNAHGKGYAKLGAGWLEWALAAPASTNPILDPDGGYAAMGQSGEVWFLAGTLGGAVTRAITVPTGTALFFPIVNNFWVNTPEFGDPAWSQEQEAVARAFLAEAVDTAENLLLEIDGKPFPVSEAFRIPSTVGRCVLPADNIFGLVEIAGPHDCVADGYWALLPPLSVGRHTIHFAGGFNGFALDVTYQVTVKPRQKAAEGSIVPHR